MTISVGERIKKIRLSLGLSQEHFARLIGASNKTIQRWEANECTPSKLYLSKLEKMKVKT